MLPRVLSVVAALGMALLPAAAFQAQREPPPLPPGLKPNAPPAEQRPGEPPPLPAGLEVQARGPIHEAFAEPGAPPAPTPAVPKQPPAPIEELPPEQRPAGESVQWISGYWQWDEERNNHIWISGCWRVPPPGKVWLPGRWQQAAAGWQWAPGVWVDAQQSEVELLPTPPALKQEAVPQLASGQVYEPGCWIYRAKNYVWRPGFAVTVPKGWVWVSAQYTWTPAGCLFAEGHWDYPLGERGLLFAPVAFAGPSDKVTNFVPRHVVRDACLLGALFVRPACHHYYFGDYFEARYEKLGYVPWTRYRLAGPVGDSLFGYYRLHAGERDWEQSIQNLYAARYAGQALRPPRTLVEQETFVRSTAPARNLTASQVQQVTLLAPLLQYEIAGRKVEQIRREDWTAYRQSATALAHFGQEFQRREIQVFSERGGAKALADGPIVVKWDKGHPHGGPPGQLKKFNAPPFPIDDEHKGGKHKKEK